VARYLITGGAGFIGSALASRLIKENHEVHIIDFEYRIEQAEKKLNGAVLHCGNISEQNTFESLPKGSYDAAFHMAAQTSARVSEENPMFDIESNIKGSYYFCKWARQLRPKRVVFTSSMAVYGSHGDNIDENAPLNPVSVYGVTKKAGEDFFKILSKDGVQTSIFRLFNVYGPGQDFTNMKQGMLSIFIAQALLSGEIRVTGSLDRYRDFVFIDDVLSALLIDSGESAIEILNVGNGIPTTVQELCNIIAKKINNKRKNIQIIETDSHRGDVFGNYSDVSKLLSLGWVPTTNLEQGINSTLASAIEELI
jgi:UDP-glucose 4-epimerase